MPNKHFCQGPHCHTYPTTDRFLKSKGVLRGRYAFADVDNKSRYGYAQISDSYFCSQGCKNQWLNENMTLIEMGIPVPFIRERRFTEGYEKKKITYENTNYSYNTIQKIGVDNNAEQ